MECPIKRIAQKDPSRLAYCAQTDSYSYGALEALIASCHYPQGRFIPLVEPTPWELFAVFRAKSCALLLSKRLPKRTLNTLRARYARLKPPPEAATALFTSGTSAAPKLACHSLAQHLLSAQSSIDVQGITSSSRYLSSLPLCHVGGLAIYFRTFLAGAQLVSSVAEATHLSLVPTQLQRLLADTIDTDTAENILIGGDHCPRELFVAAKRRGLPVHTTYGMTETTAQIAYDGAVLPHCRIALGEDNEILVSSKALFLGYFSEKGLISPIDERGWYHTSDIGAFDSKGRIEVLGRRDRMFISGGENIQPEEIEAALLKHPHIKRCRVQAQKDPIYGHRPIAFIDPLIDKEELLSFLKSNIQKFKIPQDFYSM